MGFFCFTLSFCQKSIAFYFSHKRTNRTTVTVAAVTFSVEIIFSVSNLFAWSDRCSSRLSVQFYEVFFISFFVNVNG